MNWVKCEAKAIGKTVNWHCLVWVLLLGLGQSEADAGDWPQILGPNRNGVAEGEKLLASWPAAGPKLVWERAVGSGFAGVAVADGKAVLFHRVGNEEVVEAMQADTGRVLWKQTFATDYTSQISTDSGPRCVPVLHDGMAYLYGSGGNLHAVKLATGEKVWTRTLLQDFEGSEGYFGAGSTPLVMSEKLLVNVGGKGAGIVALDPKSGKTVWKGTDEQASYSSPMAAQLLGKPVAVFITRLNLVVIEPMTGKVLFTKPFGARGPTVNGANPLVLGDHIFLSASYGVGASWCHVTATGLNAVWENDDTLSSQYPTAVHNQGILFGIHGRQDIGLAALRAIDPKQGKVLWSQEQFGMACPILADGKILLPKTSGELVLAEANPQRFAELASTTLFNSTVQALPALSHGLLYLRDTQTLKCLEVGKR